MNNIYATTEISPKKIHCGDELNIMLKLTGIPHLINNPADIVIMIDRSGSMNNASMEYMKAAIKNFITLIDKATDKKINEIIGYGSRIGILSFSSSATINYNLTSDVEQLNNFQNSLIASGKTNHYDAFSLALKMLKNSENQKIIILFTDSRSNMGGDATSLATKAKENGIDIYCVGLTGLYGIDIETLKKWSSLPSDDYLAITPNPEELNQIFEKIAHKIINNNAPVATNISIYQKLSENFTEPYNITVSKGNIKRNNDGSFIWEIDTLAKDKMEEIIMKYTTTNTGTTSGTEEPIKTANYVDNENNKVAISSSSTDVDCTPIVVEECPTAVEMDFDNCSDAMEFDAGEVEMQSMGRIMQIDVTVPNVCPNRRVALAVVLNELDEDGNEYKRGLKTFTIPAHNYSTCQDVMVKCIKFVLPEDLNVSSDSTTLCSERSFNTKLIAHYIDTDYECCPDDDDSAVTSSN